MTNNYEITKELVLNSWEDGIDDFDYMRYQDEEGHSSFILKPNHGNPKNEKTKQAIESDKGIDYPLDIWILLSNYIKPEQIGTFAAICWTSYSVINSAQFWRKIYNRYYRPNIKLPTILGPTCLHRVCGIKTLVIRALYHMYEPFVRKIQSRCDKSHPNDLSKKQCILMWHREDKNYWIYYFKLKHMNSDWSLNLQSKKRNFLDLLDDVNVNSEENCKILQITCLNSIPPPSVQGLFLTSVTVTLSQNFRQNKVVLTFSSYSCKSSNDLSVLLDPVVRIRILDWWHPFYPHSYNADVLKRDDSND